MIHWHGKPVGDIGRAFADAAERAGMDPAEVTPHVLRHTAASHLLGAGAPIWKVARLLGQSVQRTTERYGHLAPDWLTEQVETLDRLIGPQDRSHNLLSQDEGQIDQALEETGGAEGNRTPDLCNVVERAIRPQTLTRKNALFAGSEGGGRTWVTIATLLTTAKLNDVDPCAWLKITLQRIADGWPYRDVDALMPWNQRQF